MKIKVNPRLLTQTLSYHQYSNVKTIIAEYVANAWDADATEVSITIPIDFATEPIVIQDNGEGIDLVAFSEISRNRQENNRKWTNSSRPVIGTKGIGRWAGFAIASSIEYETVRNGVVSKFVFVKNELERVSTLDEYQCMVEEIESDLSRGTRVTLNVLQGRTIPDPQDIIKELSFEFACSPDFIIKVNDKVIAEEDLPGRRVELNEYSDVFGDVKGYINITNTPAKKRPSGIIIRVHNRRVVGPAFFGVDREISKTVLNRIRGEITVNALEDIIASNREAFIEHEERYRALEAWLQEKITEIAATVQIDDQVDIYSNVMSIPEVHFKYINLPTFKQREFNRQLNEFAPRLRRVSKDKELLTLFAELLIRALDSNEFVRILSRLKETETSDLIALAGVLEEWGFSEVARASHIIQQRMKALEKFAELVRDDATLELQHVHRALENNTWLLDERYDLYFSNKSLKKIAEELGGHIENDHALQRPDLILKGNSNNDFILVELKRPKKVIDIADASQLLTYKSVLAKNFPNIEKVDLYLIGRQFDQIVLSSFPQGNTQRLNLLSLDEVVQTAHHRLMWISEQIKDQLSDHAI